MGLPHDRSVQPTVMDVGGPSPQDQRSEATSHKTPCMEFVTLNINSWWPFRDRWNSEGNSEEIQSATVMFLQEHKLTSEEDCADAADWCCARGWNAVFRPAITLQSGRASGGVAILVAQRADVGVVDPELPSEGVAHRLLGLRLAAPGLESVLVVAAYLQAGGGLNATNRTLLSTVAQWQEREQRPTIVGGDFNLKAEQISSTDFLTRSGMSISAPRSPTYRTSKCATIIDFFATPGCISNKVQGCSVLSKFPSKPHSPVRLTLNVGELEWVPVLDTPQRLPTELPFGPWREPMSWANLAAKVAEGHQYVTTYRSSQWEGVQVLDQI